MHAIPPRRAIWMSPPDARLAAAVAGDRKALEAVVVELLPRVRNLVRYLVRNDSEVEDIAQEALMAVIGGLHSHRGEGTLGAWTDRVTARATFAFLKRARRSRAQVDTGADLTAVPNPDAPPDEYAARRHAVALLNKIPDDQRHALVLHHVAGMSVPEIASELGLPLETVRSRLRIGMGKLRALHEGES